MTNNEPFHYPPELFSLLVDAAPLLNRSKSDVLLFFEGAGVRAEMLRDLYERLKADRHSISKYEIARTVLRRLNESGDRTLRQRREVVRRVVEFTNFDACWADDRLKARGAVDAVRDIVNQKDSFTRMKIERDKERQERLAVLAEEGRAKLEQTVKIEEANKSSMHCLGRRSRRRSAADDLRLRYTISFGPTVFQFTNRSISSVRGVKAS